jgi:hypothetical protein
MRVRKTLLLGVAVAIFSLIAFDKYPKNNSEDALKKVLFDYFNGIKNIDTATMRSVTTRDIVIYEEGKEYNNDSVFRDMRSLIPYKVDFKFENFSIFADENSGFMSYYENANFVVRDTVKFNLNFLGSAAFRKEGGVWKMCLLHSTQRYKRRR